MEGDFRKPPLTYSANEIDAYQILLQLPVLVCETYSRLNCFGVNWGFKRRGSNPLPTSIKDKVRDPATQVSSSPGEFQENLKRKRKHGDVKHESGRMKAFNLGSKAMKQDNPISPLGIHNIPFDLLAQEFNLNEANRILDKTMAAQAGRTRPRTLSASRQCYPILT
ncbi:uncharacterized protein LOC122277164 [Carya illinoinensis]|uniref:Uncharacterized protein n=1 Tax=Carya illinoinensis TaxID=32201 RepID=A0A922E3Y9_CARIL|nr:uncharacterized protein LOC122277164 [Carya illinoinensis]KAG6696190.1 hypothetical protein I3842_09G135700 [Carya illinoinensis]